MMPPLVKTDGDLGNPNVCVPHAPEAVVLVTVQLPVLDEAAERCLALLLTGVDVVSLPLSGRGCHTPAARLPDIEVDQAAGVERLLAEREEASLELVGQLDPKKRTKVLTPYSSAVAATFAAGSIPSDGTPTFTIHWTRYPS